MHVAVFIVVFGLIGSVAVWKSLAVSPNAGGGKKGGSTQTYTPMAVVYDKYQTTTNPARSCEGEDDFGDWKVAGSLNPGESYTFTSKYPLCESAIKAVTARASWDQSTLKLTTKNLAPDPYIGGLSDKSQVGKDVTAINFGNAASACLFEFVHYPDNNPVGASWSPLGPNANSTINPSFTITNVGNATAYNVSVVGTARNLWTQILNEPCHTADADHDGWNDMYELATLEVTSEASNGGLTVSKLGLNGSDYLSYTSSPTPDDETDRYPADFNDDGQVDQTDVDRLQAQLGQGNGRGLYEIRHDVTSGDPAGWYQNNNPWRRFDLNADGRVDNRDLAIEQSLVGKPIPMTSDAIAPTLEIKVPPANTTVTSGSYFTLQALATDNEFLTHVDFLVNGNLTCNATLPGYTGEVTGDYYCGWRVPKGAGKTYTISIIAYDQAGNVTSANTVVTSN